MFERGDVIKGYTLLNVDLAVELEVAGELKLFPKVSKDLQYFRISLEARMRISGLKPAPMKYNAAPPKKVGSENPYFSR